MRRGDAAALPRTLTAAGVQREITIHVHRRSHMRSEITVENLIDVLENWVARGIRYDESDRPSMAHLGWIQHGGARRLMRVAVSMDDQRITTAFADTPATDKWNSGDFDYFQRTYEQWEIRNEAESAL